MKPERSELFSWFSFPSEWDQSTIDQLLIQIVDKITYVRDGVGFSVARSNWNTDDKRIDMCFAPYALPHNTTTVKYPGKYSGQVFLEEILRISGGYSPAAEQEKAWREIVLTLLNGGCDYIYDIESDYAYITVINNDGTLRAGNNEPHYDDAPPEELLDFLDSITDEKDGD